MKRALIVVVLAALAAVAGAPAEASRHAADCPRVELASVLEAPAPGARSLKFDNGPGLDLSAEDLVGPADLTNAYVSVTEGQTVLNLAFRPEAARRVRKFTAGHVGGRIAMLVDGQPMKVVKVLDPIRGDGILIGPLARRDAEALAQRINACAERR